MTSCHQFRVCRCPLIKGHGAMYGLHTYLSQMSRRTRSFPKSHYAKHFEPEKPVHLSPPEKTKKNSLPWTQLKNLKDTEHSRHF